MTELSPAARAVLDAYDAKQAEMHEVTWLTRNPDRDCLAAAIRAAADQMSNHHSRAYLYSLADGLKLKAIADEIETQ